MAFSENIGSWTSVIGMAVPSIGDNTLTTFFIKTHLLDDFVIVCIFDYHYNTIHLV
jgi:hypothetical protein